MQNNAEFLQLLERLKLEKRLNDSEVGLMLDVEPTYLSKIRSGKKNAGPKLMRQIRKVFAESPGDGIHLVKLGKDDESNLQDVCKMSRNPPEKIIEMAINYYVQLVKLKRSLPLTPEGIEHGHQ